MSQTGQAPNLLSTHFPFAPNNRHALPGGNALRLHGAANLARHREQRLARGAGVFQETRLQRRAHYRIRIHSHVLLKRPFQLFGKNHR
jgi:hypothetical protein